MEALALDVKCYDAYDQLVSGEMMSTDEGEYLEALKLIGYSTKSFQNGNLFKALRTRNRHPKTQTFVRLIYTARLRKYKHAEEHALTRRRLSEEFGLSDNPDVLFSFADALYTQFRWTDCYAITSRCVH